MDFNDLEVKDLLQLQVAVTNELMDRKVVRTQNNPLGDYTEWLVANALGLELVANSKAGYDAISKDGLKVQIKGRRITLKNKSRQLSAIRNYEDKDFDALAVVVFDEDFNVLDAALIPHEVVGEYSSYRKHVNAHNLIAKGPILSDSRVECIKKAVVSQQEASKNPDSKRGAQFTLEPGHWYACELIGDEFVNTQHRYSPIRVSATRPVGDSNGLLQIDFYHANYPEGVRDKTYTLENIECGSGFFLAKSVEHDPVRIVIIYDIDWQWISKHFPTVQESEIDVQEWLAHNV